jgi:hypothetical protein
MTRSRSDQGQITVMDWYPLPSSEFGTVVPDPLKPTTIYGVGYGNGQGNGMIKIDLATGQWGNVAPNFAQTETYTLSLVISGNGLTPPSSPGRCTWVTTASSLRVMAPRRGKLSVPTLLRPRASL